MEITFDGGKVITAHIGGHEIRSDQPVDGGGGNSAPSPYDLFLASIGTCAGIYVKSYCDNHQIPSDGIKIIQHHEWNKESGLPIKISLDIQVPASFPEKYKASLIHVANLCKVKKTMAAPPEFTITTTTI
jgi:putative redox protein